MNVVVELSPADSRRAEAVKRRIVSMLRWYAENGANPEYGLSQIEIANFARYADQIDVEPIPSTYREFTEVAARARLFYVARRVYRAFRIAHRFGNRWLRKAGLEPCCAKDTCTRCGLVVPGCAIFFVSRAYRWCPFCRVAEIDGPDASFYRRKKS